MTHLPSGPPSEPDVSVLDVSCDEPTDCVASYAGRLTPLLPWEQGHSVIATYCSTLIGEVLGGSLLQSY